MISSADFKLSLLRATGASAPPIAPEEGPQPWEPVRQRTSCRADPMTVSGQLSCPPAGSFVAVSGQNFMAADRLSTAWPCGRPILPTWS